MQLSSHLKEEKRKLRVVLHWLISLGNEDGCDIHHIKDKRHHEGWNIRPCKVVNISDQRNRQGATDTGDEIYTRIDFYTSGWTKELCGEEWERNATHGKDCTK